MAKVYLSSTVLDLQDERRTASDWLIAAGHQPVHSYVADNETVRDSCLEDIAGCDLYLLLLGHRYGYVPEQDNPEGLSITHLEFRRAGELGLPRIALMRTSVPDINHTDLLDPERNQRLRAFHAEVRQTVRPAEFKDEADLVAALSTGVQRAVSSANPGTATRARAPATPRPGPATPAPKPAVHPEGGGWWTTLPGLLTGAAAVITALTGLVAVFVSRGESPADTPPAVASAPQHQAAPAAAPASSPPPAVSPAAPVLPRVSLTGPAEVSFQKYRPSTYTVLGLEAVNRTPTQYGLRVRVRLLTLSGMDMNFWDSAFRLLIDGLPTAPDSNLNELVPGNAFKDADITFPVPMGARQLALRIIHHQSLGETADLPLRLGDTPAAAEAGAPPAAGQSVNTGDIGAGARVNIRQSQ